MKKVFDTISNRVYNVLNNKGFSKTEQDDNYLSIFSNGVIAYSVVYDKEKQQFQLNTCAVENDKPNNDWKNLISWLFDPKDYTQKDIDCIATDFEEAVGASKSKLSSQSNAKKKSSSSDDSNIGIAFFANRLVNIFPELKQDIKEEKSYYETFRTVGFIEEKVLPKMNQFWFRRPKNNELKKLGNILSDAYKSGDLDVRGAITILILNSIVSEDDREKLKPYLSEELVKSWKICSKMKIEKIKPEKIKKQKGIVARTLNK